MANIPEIRKHLNGVAKQLDDVFERTRSIYRDLQDYVAPWSGIGLSAEDGSEDLEDYDRKDLKIIDSTATYAVEVLAAGMQSGLTSPARPWFRLGLSNGEMSEDPEIKQWLHMVENEMRYVFSRSNVYQGLHHVYKELGSFGTAAMAMLFNFDTVLRCRPFTVGEYRIGLSAELRPNTFLSYCYMNARQLVEQFGRENVSEPVISAYENGSSEKMFKVAWLVEPNDDRIKAKDFLNRPFRSMYFECSGREDKVLDLSGFKSFPIVSPRWDVVSNKSYGNGPGHVTLGNVKMLQKMQEKGLIALDKSVDPPLVGPSDLKQTIINTMPGGVTAIDEMTGTQGLRPLYEMRPDFQALEFKIEATRTQIKTGFYNDLFLMLANQPLRSGITATEIAERHEEKLIMLGPVLERLHAELLDPLIDRTFELMLENDMIPPAPEQLQGAEIKVEYISILAQAQKMVATTSVNQFFGFAGQLAAANPEVLDKIDFDQAVDVYADLTGVPPSLVVPDDQVAAKRQARAQQQMAQTAMSMMQPAAQSVKAMADAPMDANSALDALMGRPRP